MKVEIINPETVKNLYKNHGEFACVCYGTSEYYANAVGKSCSQSGHMSGSRCEYIKFKVTGIDRGTAEQCLRHEIGVNVPIDHQDNYHFTDFLDRIANLPADSIVKNMASFRYIDKDGFDYEIPKTIASIPEAKVRYSNLMKVINHERREIKRLLESRGIEKHLATQDANFVLPRATTTSFVIGLTPEALIRFCNKRLCRRAQEFIRKLATMMKDEVGKYNRSFANELVPECEHLLWCPEGKHTCGKQPTREQLIETLRKETQ